MSLETKRIKELFGYARTLTKEQGVGVMAGRAVGFFKRRFFGKKARYLPSKQTLEAQRADAAARADGWPTISILTPLYNTPPQFLQQFLDSVQAQTAPNWQLVLVDASDGVHPDVGETVRARAAQDGGVHGVLRGQRAHAPLHALLAQSLRQAQALQAHALRQRGKQLVRA